MLVCIFYYQPLFFGHLRCVTHCIVQIINEQSVQVCDATGVAPVP